MKSEQTNLNLRQPTPNVVNGASKPVNNTPQRAINYPKVGVVDVPTISKTPLNDTLTLKKQETPKMAYKLTTKKQTGLTLQNFFSLSIIGCALFALISELKK